MREPISAAWVGASSTNAQIVSLVITCQQKTNSATRQQPPEPAQQFLPRGAAAPERWPAMRPDHRHYWIRLRIRLEEYSANITMTMMRSRMAAAVSYS